MFAHPQFEPKVRCTAHGPFFVRLPYMHVYCTKCWLGWCYMHMHQASRLSGVTICVGYGGGEVGRW